MSIGLTGQFNGRARLSTRYDGDFSIDSTRDVGRNFDWSGGAVLPSIGQTTTVTDIAKNTNFHLPNVKAASTSSVQSVNASQVDTGAARGQVAGVKADYMAKDAQIKTVAKNAMVQEVGAKNAGQSLGQLIPGGGVTKIQAVATALDPTGIVGSIYAVLDAIHGEMNRLSNAKINEVLGATLSRLQQPAHAQEHGDMNGARQLVPDEFDFSDLMVSNLKSFLERNPDNDPVMRMATDIETALDNVENNNSIVRGHDYSSGDMVEKAAAAAAIGDVGGAMVFTTNQAEADAVIAGADVAEVLNASEVVSQSATLGDIKGVKTGGASLVSEFAQASPEASEPSQGIEYDTTKMPSMNSAA